MIDFAGVKAITIPEGNVIKITCDDEILWEAQNFYTVTYRLSNATLSNSSPRVDINSPYTTTITTTNGHQPIVSVLMDGVDVTSSVYDGSNTITIPSVTGAVVITVSEALFNWLPVSTDTDRTTIYNGIGYYNGKRWSSSGNSITNGNNTTSMTGFIPCKPGDILRIYNFTEQGNTNWYVITFNDSNTVVKCVARTGDGTSPTGKYEAPGYSEIILSASTYGSNFTSLRLSWGQFNADSIVTINQEIPH